MSGEEKEGTQPEGEGAAGARSRVSLPVSALRRFRSYQRLLSQDFRRTETIGLIIISLGLGIFTGTVCSLFEYIPDVIISLRVKYLPELGHGPLFWLAAFSLSFILAGIAMYLTARIAPEAGGSGIPEIEGALLSLRPVRWKRVLPVKFFTGLMSLGSGMILGREGPSIQLGGAAGAMLADLRHGTNHQFRRHALIAAGAAAGLTSAFNAPLAGILFVYEELRAQFRFSFASIQAVSAAVLAACCVRQLMFGSDPVFDVPDFKAPPLMFLVFCAILGVFTGVVGSLFNYLVEKMQNFYGALSHGKAALKTLAAAMVGGAFGCITFLLPDASGSGMSSIPSFITGSRGIMILALLLLARFCGTLLCFCSGIPGGVFAPSLAIGTLTGAVFGVFCRDVLGIPGFPAEAFAVIGMCAFFASSVRAPVTGLVLVTEMTGDYGLILPMLMSCFTASMTARGLRSTPIYTQILMRTLKAAGNLEGLALIRNLARR